MNQPDGMQVAFDTANIEVRIKKSDESLDDLTEDETKLLLIWMARKRAVMKFR